MITKIERMDHLGNGIGYINDKITFIKNALPGEIVDVSVTEEKSRFSKAKINKIITSSSDRIKSFCPYFEKCGGCSLSILNYDKTLDYKKNRVCNILQEFNINPIVIKNKYPLNYRNKISLKIMNGKIGYYETESHTLVEINKCMVAKESINNAFELIKSFKIVNGNIVIRSNYNDELILIINTKDKIIIKDDYYMYKVLGIIVNNKCIYGENHFMEKVGNLFFEVSYDSFFQVNSYINEQLFSIIKENVSGNNVLDLYSGVGTLSIMASESAKNVYGIEIIPNAVLNAIKNAKINKRNNIKFILGKVEDKIEFINDKIDTIIVDPPRSGLDNKTIMNIQKMNSNKIIYISCDTQSLKRDLNILKKDYTISKFYILDMFSFSYHCECLTVLERKII